MDKSWTKVEILLFSPRSRDLAIRRVEGWNGAYFQKLHKSDWRDR